MDKWYKNYIYGWAQSKLQNSFSFETLVIMVLIFVIYFCISEFVNYFNGLDWSLLVKHLVIEDVRNSWLYCFTDPLELGTRVSVSHRQPYVSLTVSIEAS